LAVGNEEPPRIGHLQRQQLPELADQTCFRHRLNDGLGGHHPHVQVR
jgi:hypothetical protein